MSKCQRLLVVEDDENLRLTLADILEESYAVDLAETVAQAGHLLETNTYQLIILDIMLPDGDGYSFCHTLRNFDGDTPVLMLTARSLEDDLVRGFEVGADDYLVKPYRSAELLARVRALLKRATKGNSAQVANDEFQLNGFIVSRSGRRISQDDGTPVELTPKEFDVLMHLWDNPYKAISREELLNQVWGDVIVDVRTVDNFISSLKKKLALSAGNTVYIETVRGVGYRLER